jgi:Tol biopolymer transport system component
LFYRATDGFTFKSTPTIAPIPTPAPSPTAGSFVAPPQPVANTQRNRILYLASTDPTKGQQIFTAEADGSNPVALTNTPEVKSNPVWSPDGKQIAFTAGNVGIQIVNYDGSGLHTVAYNGFSPVWSPDSKQLAFLRVESAKDGKGPDGAGTVRLLYLINADGKSGDEKQIAYDALAPVWSSDGQEIIYFSLRNLVVFTAEPRLGGLVQQLKLPNNLGAWFPTFSADNKSIIFYGTPNANYLASSLDLNATFLTPTVVASAGAATVAPTATPSAATSPTVAPTAAPNQITNLYIVNRDGSNLKTLAQVEDNTGITSGSLFAAYVNNAAEGVGLLTSRPFYRVSPTLTPDGKKVAALLVTKDSVGIQVASVDGSTPALKIIGKEGNLEEGSRLSPSFSSDGNKVYYLFQPTAKDKPIEIRAYDLNTKAETPFVKDNSNGFPTCCGYKK